jgi:DNA polymerase-3 subunit epsilon
MNSRPPGLAFVDLETTGATPTVDRITEIGIVEVDQDGVREWSSLVNPGTRIPEFIERLTGISNEMVASAPAFADLADEVLSRLSDHLFVAHNARFDHGFLQNEFKRMDLDFRPRVLCTVKLSRKLYPQFHKHSLDSLIERHGLEAGGRHRALADARLIWQFWQRLHSEHDPVLIDGVIAALTARPSLPAQLDPAIVDRLPAACGVYLFYGDNDLPLYVGKGKEIRKRVLAHFSGDHAAAKEMDLRRQVRRIEWIETEGEVGASLKAAELVKRLQPSHNHRLRGDDELCAWRLRDHGLGLWRPELVSAGMLDFGREDNLFGPFKNPRQANKVLTAIAAEHGLCQVLLGLETRTPDRPCFAHDSGKCHGACVGKESPSVHSGRLMAALAALRLKPWPYPGPALLREGGVAHLVVGWRHLGTVRTEDEIWPLLETAEPLFDPDIYKILVKAGSRLSPLAHPR